MNPKGVARPIGYRYTQPEAPGGGGGTRSGKGRSRSTDCGPSAGELWLSRANNAKKGGLSSHYR